jgi:hypothetical protein
LPIKESGESAEARLLVKIIHLDSIRERDRDNPAVYGFPQSAFSFGGNSDGCDGICAVL